jgi:hypothetical protein
VKRLVRLSLSTKSSSHSVVFFSHNKLANSTFSHGLSAKRTGLNDIHYSSRHYTTTPRLAMDKLTLKAATATDELTLKIDSDSLALTL